MQRSQALRPLSRDHHQGLFVAQRLKRTDQTGAADARAAMLEFFASEGRIHFRAIEEKLSTPELAALGAALERAEGGE